MKGCSRSQCVSPLLSSFRLRGFSQTPVVSWLPGLLFLVHSQCINTSQYHVTNRQGQNFSGRRVPRKKLFHNRLIFFGALSDIPSLVLVLHPTIATSSLLSYPWQLTESCSESSATFPQTSFCCSLYGLKYGAIMAAFLWSSIVVSLDASGTSYCPEIAGYLVAIRRYLLLHLSLKGLVMFAVSWHLSLQLFFFFWEKKVRIVRPIPVWP